MKTLAALSVAFVALALLPRLAHAQSDHAVIISDNPLGIHYFGSPQVAEETVDPASGAVTTGSMPAPTFGVRDWLSDKLAVDVGLAFGYNGGSASTTVGPTSTQIGFPTSWALGLVVEAPIVLADFHHVSIFVAPGLSYFHDGVGWNDPGSTTNHYRNQDTVAASGALGGEVYLGAWDLPQVSIEARVGVGFQVQALSAGVNIGGTSAGGSGTSFSWIPVGGSIGDWFLANVGLTYYFGHAPAALTPSAGPAPAVAAPGPTQ